MESEMAVVAVDKSSEMLAGIFVELPTNTRQEGGDGVEGS